MSNPKLHHYLPRSYLRCFADENDGIILRRRGARPVRASVASAGAETHLYSVRLPDGTRDARVEGTLARFDAIGARGLASLREMSLPRHGTDERHAIALFMALQMVRTPEFETQFLFPRAVVDYAGSEDVTREHVRTYLRDVFLRFDPKEQEVTAATDFVHATCSLGVPTKAELLSMMFGLAVEQLAPRLEHMVWSIEKCRRPLFATCDTLPAKWKRPSPKDAYEGVGLDGAEETWLPLDRSHLLVLRHRGSEATSRVEPKRARFVNAHLAKHCYQALLHHPTLGVRAGDMEMAAHRPASRFWTAPGITVAPDGTEAPMGDILHMWTPIRDDV